MSQVDLTHRSMWCVNVMSVPHSYRYILTGASRYHYNPMRTLSESKIAYSDEAICLFGLFHQFFLFADSMSSTHMHVNTRYCTHPHTHGSRTSYKHIPLLLLKMHECWHRIWIVEREWRGSAGWNGVKWHQEEMLLSNVFLNSSKGDEMKFGWWRKESLSGLFKMGKKEMWLSLKSATGGERNRQRMCVVRDDTMISGTEKNLGIMNKNW